MRCGYASSTSLPAMSSLCIPELFWFTPSINEVHPLRDGDLSRVFWENYVTRLLLPEMDNCDR